MATKSGTKSNKSSAVKPVKAGKKGAKKAATKASKKGASKAAAVNSRLKEGTIRVRMYRVGFGDCFLVSLPIAKGSGIKETHRHILVDCGVHARGDIGTMSQVVNNIAEVTGKKLAVAIASHAHQDHISGYDKFGDVFSTFDIDEVWLPWTWNPNDKKAVKLQKSQIALTAQLEEHYNATAATADQKVLDAIANLKGNKHAIALLKAGFGVNAQVRYLTAGDVLTKPAGIPGLTARFLGPPQSEEFLSQMDPPKGQHYLRAVPGGSPELANEVKPFVSKWVTGNGNKSSESASERPLSKEEERRLHELADSPLDSLAFAIDQARNNESVVALLIYRGQHLLFPGDAQYGNWRWWLENEQPDDILPQISFFKVAHHGSENATPKGALERMSQGKFAAMVSTQSSPWKSIPKVTLMNRLNQKTVSRIVRSDWLTMPGAPKPLAGAVPALPSKLPKGFAKGPLWYDYLINT
jgi:beta-lactamase superfamily II metal-dependent hydrolase